MQTRFLALFTLAIVFITLLNQVSSVVLNPQQEYQPTQQAPQTEEERQKLWIEVVESQNKITQEFIKQNNLSEDDPPAFYVFLKMVNTNASQELQNWPVGPKFDGPTYTGIRTKIANAIDSSTKATNYALANGPQCFGAMTARADLDKITQNTTVPTLVTLFEEYNNATTNKTEIAAEFAKVVNDHKAAWSKVQQDISTLYVPFLKKIKSDAPTALFTFLPINTTCDSFPNATFIQSEIDSTQNEISKNDCDGPSPPSICSGLEKQLASYQDLLQARLLCNAFKDPFMAPMGGTYTLVQLTATGVQVEYGILAASALLTEAPFILLSISTPKLSEKLDDLSNSFKSLSRLDDFLSLRLFCLMKS